jgi:hypothetical protein
VQLAQCLFHENEEVVLETARVLGECDIHVGRLRP